MSNSLGDYIDEALCKTLRETGDAIGAGETTPTFEVQKLAGYVTISNEAAMEYGLIPDTRPPVHYSRWTRLRWKIQDRKWAVRRAVGFWIAGETPVGE